MRSEATHANLGPVASVHNDADATLQDKMHGVGSVTLANDDFSSGDFEPVALLCQMIGVLGADHLNQPRKQRPGLASGRMMRIDDRVLALLERVIEVAQDRKST